MARMVGFGRDRTPAPDAAAEPGRPPPGAPAAEDKPLSAVARLVIAGFLLVWLGIWSFAIVEAWAAMKSDLSGPQFGLYEVFLALFYLVWLGGALAALVFGLVLLFAIVFGRTPKAARPGLGGRGRDGGREPMRDAVRRARRGDDS